MVSKKVLITSATGYQGSGAVRQCRLAGHEVFALVRDPMSEGAKALANQGATLVKGDMDDAESLHHATQNMETVCFIPPGSRDFDAEIQRTKNIITAAQDSPTVTSLICSTAVKAGQHESFPGWGPGHPMYQYWLTKDAIEKLIRGAGFQNWTIVRPPFLLQNYIKPRQPFYLPGFADDGIMRVAWKPDSKAGWVDARDVGIVVAAAVSNAEEYSGQEISLVAENLTAEEVATTWAKVVGRPIKVHFYTEGELATLPSLGVANSHIWASTQSFAAEWEASKAFDLTSLEDFLTEHRDNGML